MFLQDQRNVIINHIPSNCHEKMSTNASETRIEIDLYMPSKNKLFNNFYFLNIHKKNFIESSVGRW